MGFGKAFILSLTAFVGLNFIFTILYYALGPDVGFDDLFNTIETDPLMILYYLFGSIIGTPFTIFNWTIAQPFLGNFDLTFLILGLGYLIAPLIAAILAGKFGESKGQCFGGWFLTAVISLVTVIIGVFLSNTFETMVSTMYLWVSFDSILIYSIICCVINIIFYGFFALLVSKIEYY